MMTRMLDMIRNSQVPSNLMQSAARGALAVPPEETIEILVYLALHSKLFAERARLTLAGWDEQSGMAAAADPKTSAEVLGYFVSPKNLRTCLLPALAENPSVKEEALDELAVSGSRAVVEGLLTSPRVMNSPQLLQALQSNANLRPTELAEIGKKLAALEANPTAAATEVDAADEVVESTVIKYLEENAAELAAEKDKPFQPIGMSLDGEGGEAEGEAAAEVGPQAAAATTSASADAETGKPATAAAGRPVASAVALKAKKQAPPGLEERRDSVLQKISKLDIRGRITLAMRGTKEDRSILIRDSTKLVASAVLDTPKVSDGEVEKIAL